MDKDTNKTGRQDYQLMPFIYGGHTVRTVLIDEMPWFIAKDVCDVLGIQKSGLTFNDFPDSEKGRYTISTLGGDQEMLAVNEPGLYRLIFQSRKPEAEDFKTRVFTEILPQIRKTGIIGMLGGEGNVGEIYRLFSAANDMTINRIHKMLYYFALYPPLTNKDIAKLLNANDTTIGNWRRILTQEMALNAVKALGINAYGFALGQNNLLPAGEARSSSPPAHPAKEAQDAGN